MPTGYTAPIADGITFEQYALNCARAFGALITMRDAPANMPIPDRIEPSDYHQRSMEIAHTTLERLSLLTAAQVDAEYRADFEKRLADHVARLQRAGDLRAAYEAMLAKVRAWKAPTDEHVEYKSFMEKQIIDSINFDCDTSYDKPPVACKPSEWLAEYVADLRNSIERHEKQHREEVARAHARTMWVRALRESL